MTNTNVTLELIDSTNLNTIISNLDNSSFNLYFNLHFVNWEYELINTSTILENSKNLWEVVIYNNDYNEDELYNNLQTQINELIEQYNYNS